MFFVLKIIKITYFFIFKILFFYISISKQLKKLKKLILNRKKLNFNEKSFLNIYKEGYEVLKNTSDVNENGDET